MPRPAVAAPKSASSSHAGASVTDAADASSQSLLAEGALGEVVGYQITLAAIAARQLFGRHIGIPMGLRPVDYTILMLLQANDGATQKALGHTLAVSAPKLTQLLDRLQERELLTRVRSDTDRRAQHLHLTRQGQQVARRAQEASRAMEDEMAGVLSPGERAMLMELLRKVAWMPATRSPRRRATQASKGSPT